MKANIIYPVDFIFIDEKYKILDGIHRLAKCYMYNVSEINIRRYHHSVLTKISL